MRIPIVFSLQSISVLSCLQSVRGLAAALPKDEVIEGRQSRNVSGAIFDELEELARLVDISYCVGVTGIWSPFECVSRCKDFFGYELITVSLPF